MKKSNIKRRIFVLQLLILFIPFILFNIYKYNKTVIQLEKEQLKLLDLKSDYVESIFDHFGKSLKTYALMASKSDELENAVLLLKNEKSWNTEDQDDIRNYPKEGFSNFENKEYDKRIIKLRKVAKELFTTLNNEHSYIGNLDIVNSNRTIIMRGHRDKRGDIKNDKLIKNAVKGISSYGLLVSDRTGQPSIDGVAPIYVDGNIIGAIKIGMYINKEVTEQIESEADVSFFAFDHNELVEVKGFESKYSISEDYNQLPKFYIFKSFEDPEVEKFELIDEIYYDYIMKGKSYVNLYSKNYFGGYALKIGPIKNYDGTVIGAFMVVIENYELINSLKVEKDESIKQMLIIFFTSLLISSIFSNQIGNPLINFKNQLHKMKEVDAIIYLENIYGPQELLDMAFEFNSLVDAISYEKNKNEILEIISNVDGLTNLFNHQKFYKDIKILFDTKNEFSLIFLDLDKFKSINDSLGHLVGDNILREVSNLLKNFEKENVDNYFTPYRYGGEEFAVLLNKSSRGEAYLMAEKIRVMISSSPILKSISLNLSVTISAGVATYPYDAKIDAELVENADIAMYYSKNNGRNKTTKYTISLKDFF